MDLLDFWRLGEKEEASIDVFSFARRTQARAGRTRKPCATREEMGSELKELRERMKMLEAQRGLLEVEADAIHSELTSCGPNGEPPAGIKDPLVDSEGFPRNDVDLYNVRNKRARLATINFDHSALMKEIEQLLTRIHQLALAEELASPPEIDVMSLAPFRTQEPQQEQVEPESRPIAILDELLEGSPASEAGVQNGDLLLKFGHVTASTFNPLPAIAKVVGESVSKEITITVRRGDQHLTLTLVPRPWGGRGLLGCHLTPYSS